MPNFIFTYGSDSKNQPYRGGWTKVIAEDSGDAVRAFNLFHPLTAEGCIACAFIYEMEEFLKTDMATKNESFGHGTREVITVNHSLQQNSPDDFSDVVSYRREVIDAS